MNLKVAAQLLDVHYQTAYRWVRSGELAAVRIGGRYDVSEAAITQFQASRRSMTADVESARPQPVSDLTRDDVLDELEAMALDPILTPASAIAFAARRGSTVLGDVCLVSLIRADGSLGHGTIDHVHPDRAAFIGAIASSMSMTPTIDQNAVIVPIATGTTLRIPHVRQDQLRAAIRPELLQHLPKYTIHSLLSAPISARDTTFGIITFARDSPGRPYTLADEQFVGQMAARLGSLIQSAHEIKQAWRVRRACQAAIQAHLAGRASDPQSSLHPPAGAQIEQLLATVPEATELAVAVFDAQGRILATNEALRARSGWPTSKALNEQDRSGLAHPDDLDQDRAGMERLMSGEIDHLDVHARRLRADGRYVECASHRAAIRDADATLICVVTVARELHLPTTPAR